MVRKPSKAVFISKELNDFLESLDPQNKLKKWIQDMKIVLKEDMMAGEPIQKKQIASHYLQRYEVYNLYRYRHPEGYRSCYTCLLYTSDAADE